VASSSHGAAVRRLEGEHAFFEVIEQVHVLLHVVADDGGLVHGQRAVWPARAEHHHARRAIVHGPPVILWRHRDVPAAASKMQDQRGYQLPDVPMRHGRAQVEPFRPGRRRHDAGAQLLNELISQCLVRHVDEARERGARVDERTRPQPRRDLPEVKRGLGDGELGIPHRDASEGKVVERAERVDVRVLEERHGRGRRAPAAQAGGRADEQAARVRALAEVGREAVRELVVSELGHQRQVAPAQPDDAGRAVQGARREPGRGDAPEGEAHVLRLRLERERLGAEDPADDPGAVGGEHGARLVVARAPGLGAERARGVVARHGPGRARPGRVVEGEVLAEAAGRLAGRALRPDEVAAGVDDGLRLLRRVADEVLRDVLRLGPVDGRARLAHGRKPAVGALRGAAHALLGAAVLLGVDVGELEPEACCTGAKRQGGAQEREPQQGSRHFCVMCELLGECVCRTADEEVRTCRVGLFI
jgi:hypothetical protein